MAQDARLVPLATVEINQCARPNRAHGTAAGSVAGGIAITSRLAKCQVDAALRICGQARKAVLGPKDTAVGENNVVIRLAILSESRVGLRSEGAFLRRFKKLDGGRPGQDAGNVVGGGVQFVADQTAHLNRMVLIETDAGSILRPVILAPLGTGNLVSDPKAVLGIVRQGAARFEIE